jgi:hypothetical protein
MTLIFCERFSSETFSKIFYKTFLLFDFMDKSLEMILFGVFCEEFFTIAEITINLLAFVSN